METKSGGGGSSVPTARARVSQVQMSFGKMMGHPVLTGGRKGEVDVDDVLWLFMKHWLVSFRASRYYYSKVEVIVCPY